MSKYDMEAIRKMDTGEIGSTGLNRHGEYVIEDRIKELRGHRKYKTLKEMRDTDPVIGSLLFAIEMVARGVSWTTVPFDDSNAHRERADFVYGCMTDMSHTWESFIAEALSMCPMGFSLHEIVWKRRQGAHLNPSARSRFKDGKIGLRKLPIRGQETIVGWHFAEDGGVQAALQQAPPTHKRVAIPIEKSLLFRTTGHLGNPEGRSILTNAFRPWFLKKNIENIEAIGIERDLAGIPVMYVPPAYLDRNATADIKAVAEKLKEILANVKRDEQEGLMLPLVYDEHSNPIFKFELLSSSGKRQFETDTVIGRYNTMILMTALADFILLGHEKVGSFALGDMKSEMFSLAMKAWLDEICEVVNRHLIPRLFALNGWPLDELPRVEHGRIGKVDLKSIATYVKDLAASGMPLFPDATLENWLRDQADMPERPEEFDGIPMPGTPEAEAEEEEEKAAEEEEAEAEEEEEIEEEEEEED